MEQQQQQNGKKQKKFHTVQGFILLMKNKYTNLSYSPKISAFCWYKLEKLAKSRKFFSLNEC